MLVILLILAAVLLLALLALGKVPWSYTVRNLTLRWMTTLMTALAFTLVIASLTVMLAFVKGMQRMTEGTGQPGNVLILADGATDEVFSNLASTDLTDIENEPAVVREHGRPLAARETFVVVNMPIANASGQAKRRFLQLRGLDDPAMAARVHGLHLLPGGTWFSEAGVRELPASVSGGANGETAIEAVLGEGAARELGRDRTSEQLAVAANPHRLDPGETFSLGNRTWIVVGILESPGSTFTSEVWAKRSLVGALFGKDTYSSLVVRTADDRAARQFCAFMKEKYKKAAVAPQVEADYYESLSNTNKQFLWTIAFLTCVMSIGGISGVMITMFAAISQRIKDIGVLRLLGYAPRQILVAFLLESLLISLIGGLLGCGIGSLANGWTATSIIAGGIGHGKSVMLKLAVDANILAVGILVALLMGILGGVFPAFSAMRLRPLDALR